LGGPVPRFGLKPAAAIAALKLPYAACTILADGQSPAS
jgi:hypothetical protein